MSRRVYFFLFLSILATAMAALLAFWLNSPNPKAQLSPLNEWQLESRNQFAAICESDPILARVSRRITQARESTTSNEDANVEPFSLRKVDRRQLSASLRAHSITNYGLRQISDDESLELANQDFSWASSKVGQLVQTDESSMMLLRCAIEQAQGQLVLLGAKPLPTWVNKSQLSFLARGQKDRLLGRVLPSSKALLISLAFASFLALIVVFFFATLSRRRMRTLLDVTRTMAGGNISTMDQLDPSKTAVIGALRNDLDEMANALHSEKSERQEIQRRALRAERIAAWRDVARMVAHEIKNPLSPIQLSVQTLRKAKQNEHPEFDEIFAESTQTVLEEVTRMKELVNEFSAFARLPRPKSTPLDLGELTSQIVSMHKREGLELSLESESIKLRGDTDQLRQIIINLLQNAIDAATENEPAQVRIKATSDDTYATLIFEDNGPGIDDEDKSRIFEPYFTQKSHGTGLGLAIVQRIVHDHLGLIRVEDSKLGGAKIIVSLAKVGPLSEIEATVID